RKNAKIIPIGALQNPNQVSIFFKIDGNGPIEEMQVDSGQPQIIVNPGVLQQTAIQQTTIQQNELQKVQPQIGSGENLPETIFDDANIPQDNYNSSAPQTQETLATITPNQNSSNWPRSFDIHTPNRLAKSNRNVGYIPSIRKKILQLKVTQGAEGIPPQ
ncbi:hypothetical protein MEO41_27390, partial [Dolichospermum sp. ST_sed4]|nr:hypothetical protein [Dolichospermum sp. ST_sed4]